jgi:hypothetical protein
MATRSRIGYKNNDLVFSAYCHYDGYLGYNGRMLLKHYTDEEKVKALVSLGYISSLQKDIDTIIEKDIDKGSIKKEPMVCTLKEYENYDNELIEYCYLFDNGVWKVRKNGTKFYPFTLLDCD